MAKKRSSETGKQADECRASIAGELWQKFKVTRLLKQLMNIEPKTCVLCPSLEVKLSQLIQLIQLSKHSCQK